MQHEADPAPPGPEPHHPAGMISAGTGRRMVEYGYLAETGRPAGGRAGTAAERGKHWWPVALAILVAAGLHVALPAEYRIQPGWVVPAVLLGLLAVLIAEDPGRIDRQKPWLRLVLGVTIAFITVAHHARRRPARRRTSSPTTSSSRITRAGCRRGRHDLGDERYRVRAVVLGSRPRRGRCPGPSPATGTRRSSSRKCCTTTTCPPPGCRSSWTTSRCPFGPPPRSVLPTSPRSSRGPSCMMMLEAGCSIVLVALVIARAINVL